MARAPSRARAHVGRSFLARSTGARDPAILAPAVRANESLPILSAAPAGEEQTPAGNAPHARTRFRLVGLRALECFPV